VDSIIPLSSDGAEKATEKTETGEEKEKSETEKSKSSESSVRESRHKKKEVFAAPLTSASCMRAWAKRCSTDESLAALTLSLNKQRAQETKSQPSHLKSVECRPSRETSSYSSTRDQREASGFHYVRLLLCNLGLFPSGPLNIQELQCGPSLMLDIKTLDALPVRVPHQLTVLYRKPGQNSVETMLSNRSREHLAPSYESFLESMTQIPTLRGHQGLQLQVATHSTYTQDELQASFANNTVCLIWSEDRTGFFDSSPLDFRNPRCLRADPCWPLTRLDSNVRVFILVWEHDASPGESTELQSRLFRVKARVNRDTKDDDRTSTEYTVLPGICFDQLVCGSALAFTIHTAVVTLLEQLEAAAPTDPPNPTAARRAVIEHISSEHATRSAAASVGTYRSLFGQQNAADPSRETVDLEKTQMDAASDRLRRTKLQDGRGSLYKSLTSNSNRVGGMVHSGSFNPSNRRTKNFPTMGTGRRSTRKY
jgi:hypothetical protein